MPFTNPVVAGDEIIYPVRVSGPVASFDDLNAVDNLTYRGEELTTVLDRRGRGFLAHASLSPSLITTSGEAIILYLDVTAEAGRVYKVWSNVITTDTAGATGEFRVRITFNGAVPTTTSSVLCTSMRCTQFTPCYLSEIYSVGATCTARMALTIQAQFAGSIRDFFVNQIRLVVEDIGPTIAQTGVVAVPAATKAFRTFDIQPYASRTYTGAGTPIPSPGPYDNQYMHQGDIGIDGNRRSWMWFDRNTAGLGSGGSLNNLVGALASDVMNVQVILTYPHWYYGYGGDARIGWHNNATVSSTEPSGGFPNRWSAHFPGRNLSYWINLTAFPEIVNALVGGTFQGFMLGNTGDPSRDLYGYAWGATGVLGQCPGFKVEYYK